MGRPAKPARLYFDDTRKSWVIRDTKRFIRVNKDIKPEFALQKHIANTKDKRRNLLGLIYVVAMGRYVKIGFTSVGIKTRLKYLKVSMPELPVVLAVFHGSRAHELELHHRFSALRANGEWFRNEGEITEWIATLEQFKAETVPLLGEDTILSV
jgi:hypothetical protein